MSLIPRNGVAYACDGLYWNLPIFDITITPPTTCSFDCTYEQSTRLADMFVTMQPTYKFLTHIPKEDIQCLSDAIQLARNSIGYVTRFVNICPGGISTAGIIGIVANLSEENVHIKCTYVLATHPTATLYSCVPYTESSGNRWNGSSVSGHRLIERGLNPSEIKELQNALTNALAPYAKTILAIEA